MRAEGGAYPLTHDELVSVVRGSVPGIVALPPVLAPSSGRIPAVVAIGAFDGVHQGHQELVSSCVREARGCGARAVVVTFDPDPAELLAGEHAPRRLLSIEDRMAFCRALGVDEVFVIPFTSAFAAKTPREFMAYVLDRLGAIAAVHVGSNFHFGHRGSGNVETLRHLGEELSFKVVSHDLLMLDDRPISSTRIRAELEAGRVAAAARLLGRHHFVRGTVAHGRGEGTSFGFPTANVCCDARSCLPGEGVYACIVTDGTHAWPSAANVGAPPTFAEHRDAFLEANLIGFKGDLYGADLAVVFVEWLRASRHFDSLEELERVVLGNIDWVRHNIGATSVEVGL